MRALTNNAPPSPEDITFEKACEIFWETKAVTRLKFTTRRGYEVSIDTYLLSRWMNLLIRQIGFVHVNELDAELTKQGLEPTSRANIQCAARSILRHCVDTGWLEAMPRLPRLPKAGERVLRIPDPATIDEMLAAAKPPLYVVLLLCVDAGLRAGEVRGATWRDVDLEAGKLVVRETIYHGHRDTPKSGHEREIHLTPRLKAALEAAAKKPHKPTDPLAPSSLGRVWGESSLAHAVKSLLSKLEKESHRFHDLRLSSRACSSWASARRPCVISPVTGTCTSRRGTLTRMSFHAGTPSRRPGARPLEREPAGWSIDGQWPPIPTKTLEVRAGRSRVVIRTWRSGRVV